MEKIHYYTKNKKNIKNYHYTKIILHFAVSPNCSSKVYTTLIDRML